MEVLERAIYLAIGLGIGFILGYIVARLREIKEEVDEVLDIEKQKNGEPPRRVRDDAGFMRVPLVADFMYLLVLGLVLYGVILSIEASQDIKENAKEDQISRCEAGVDNRNVQRELVEAVFNLATGAVQRPEDLPPLNEEDRLRYNAYVIRANDFREDMYEKIKPSEECAKYVEDDNVEPPSPAFPTIEAPKERP